MLQAAFMNDFNPNIKIVHLYVERAIRLPRWVFRSLPHVLENNGYVKLSSFVALCMCWP